MIPTLVHQPPGSVARSARARPSWEAEQSTVIGNAAFGRSSAAAASTGTAPSSAALASRPRRHRRKSRCRRRARRRSGPRRGRCCVRRRRRSGRRRPGVRSRWGATVRQPSTTLSQTLAACSGATPSGSGTSIASANGTRRRSLSAPPQSPPTTGPNPYIDRSGTERQLPVRPARQRAHSPQLIWNGTTTTITGRNRRYPLPHLDDLGDRLVAERDRTGDGGLAADRRLVEVAESDGDRAHERLTRALDQWSRHLEPFDVALLGQGELLHGSSGFGRTRTVVLVHRP